MHACIDQGLLQPSYVNTKYKICHKTIEACAEEIVFLVLLPHTQHNQSCIMTEHGKSFKVLLY